MVEQTGRARAGGAPLLLCLFGGLGLLLAIPIIALAALAILLEDGFPVFLWQERVGQFGRPFRILKLRTMRRDTPCLPAERLAGRLETVIRVGRVVRAWHVDELPQLWNVMMGEMALVGPRPVLSSHEALLAARRRLGIDALLPGITGLAQLVPETAVNDALKLTLDAEYARRRSLALDLWVAVGTVIPPLRRWVLIPPLPSPNSAGFEER
jgi:O-antigen biosynthesis protein WbqP